MTEAELKQRNTQRGAFEVIEGWGQEWFIAFTDTGLRSNRYKAVNVSIAHEKALMVAPEGSKVDRVELNGEVVWKS